MIGCDLHDVSMLLKVAVGTKKPIKRSFLTSNVAGMIAWFTDFANRLGNERIVFATEASGQEFDLYDDVLDTRLECHVLATTHLSHTTHRRKNKTDEKDAQMILEKAGAYVLAGRALPSVWAPGPQTRDDRDPVRLRLALSEQRTQTRTRFAIWPIE